MFDTDRLLDMMAASPGAFRSVRVLGVLNSGERENTFPTASGRVWPVPDAPKDFSVALAADAAAFTAEAALRPVPGRCRDLPIVDDEADMLVGFDRPYEPRPTERFPS